MNEAEEKMITDQKRETEKMKFRINSAMAEFKLKSAEFRLDIAVKFADYGDHSKSEEHSREAIFEAAGALLALDEFKSSNDSEIIEYIKKNYGDKGLIDAELIEALWKTVSPEATEAPAETEDPEAAVRTIRVHIKHAGQFMAAVRKYIAANYDVAGLK